MRYKVNDIEYDVEINSCVGNHAEVTVNGVVYNVEIGCGENIPVSPVVTIPQPVCTPAEDVVVNMEGSQKSISAPLPGVIVAVKVKPGDVVKAGQVVAVLEAMKMENEIQSEYDGTIISVNVSEGESILEGTSIVTIG